MKIRLLPLLLLAACSRAPEMADATPPTVVPLTNPEAMVMSMDHVPSPPLAWVPRRVAADAVNGERVVIFSEDPADAPAVRAYMDRFFEKQAGTPVPSDEPIGDFPISTAPVVTPKK